MTWLMNRIPNRWRTSNSPIHPNILNRCRGPCALHSGPDDAKAQGYVLRPGDKHREVAEESRKFRSSEKLCRPQIPEKVPLAIRGRSPLAQKVSPSSNSHLTANNRSSHVYKMSPTISINVPLVLGRALQEAQNSEGASGADETGQ